MATLTLALLAGCGGGAADATRDEAIAFTTVTRALSGVDTARTVVVRDDGAWAALWTEGTRIYFPPPPKPAIEFTHSMLIGIFLGMRPNGCYGVGIESVVRTRDGRLTVRYRESVPQPGVLCTQALVFPNEVIELPRTDLPVDFVAQS